MENYKQLSVWQKAIRLVVEIYAILKRFPSEAKFGLISQMQRAAVSVPCNIAEGWGRGFTVEYIRFLKISKGSLMELETQIIIAEKLNYIDSKQVIELSGRIDEIGRMLNGLISSLSLKIKSPNS